MRIKIIINYFCIQNTKANGAPVPHVFSVGAIALEKMLTDGADQAVLISGESGAGKLSRDI